MITISNNMNSSSKPINNKIYHRTRLFSRNNNNNNNTRRIIKKKIKNHNKIKVKYNH